VNTDAHQIIVSGVTVQVVRKPIKNLHLGVYPPHGRVRVAAPLRVSDDAVRLAVVGKLGWIKRQRARFEAQPRQSVREMVSGESHHVFGRRYRLRVVYVLGPAKVVLVGKATMELRVAQDASTEQRLRLLQGWYRQRLRERLEPLLKKWQKALGVEVAGCGIKRMKTKWGSCSAEARRIWLNLELAKKPVQCLEYLIVHELAHLIERHHNDRFTALMDEHLPDWKARRALLNAQPLAHDTWAY
jgi:predicted metal-dependent hydrolase